MNSYDQHFKRIRDLEEAVRAGRNHMKKRPSYGGAVTLQQCVGEREQLIADLRRSWRVIDNPIWEMVAA